MPSIYVLGEDIRDVRQICMRGSTSQYRLAREDLHMYADRSLVAPVCVQQVKNLLSNLGSCGYIC